MFEAHDFNLTDRPLIAWVVRLYKLLLQRLPDPEGLRSFVDTMRDGTSRAEVVETFLNGEEFKQRFPFAEGLQAEDICLLHDQEFGFCPDLPAERRQPPFDASIFIVDLIEAGDLVSPEPLSRLLFPDGLQVGDKGYEWWFLDYHGLTQTEELALVKAVQAMSFRPIISFVMWLDLPELSLLSAAIDTITNQIYPDIELLVAVSSRASSETIVHIEQVARQDSRIKVLAKRFRDPALGFNAALATCSGRLIGLVGQEDLLERSAAFEMAAHLLRFPDTTILFSDEDQVDVDGRHHSPVLKTKWDPEAMMARDAVGRIVMLATAEVKSHRGMRSRLDEFGGYDLVLRIARGVKRETIRHLPSILYHRRSKIGPAQRQSRFFWVFRDPRKRILREHLKSRMSPGFKLSFPANSPSVRVEFDLPQRPPLTSIIIPTRDRVDLLRRCIDSIFYQTAYPAIEIIIVDNDSREAETAAYLASISTDKRVRVITSGGDFNWSALNNFAVKAAKGDVLVFLNNDTEVITKNWLREMVSQAIRPEIGVVGAKLLYPDLRLQHAGIVLSAEGGLHTMRFAADDDSGYLDELSIVHSVSAVTGACMAMRRSVFEEVQGFEEENLKVTWSDVDLCLRARSRGYISIWTPWAVLLHHEVATRGSDETPEKIARAKAEHEYIKKIWREAVVQDHYQNPSLIPSERKQQLKIPSHRPMKDHGFSYPDLPNIKCG